MTTVKLRLDKGLNHGLRDLMVEYQLASIEEAVLHVLETYFRHHTPAARNAVAGLTPRQQEVLKLLAEGNSSKKIARHLDISEKTVEFHRAQIKKALGAENLVCLVRHAVNGRLVEPFDTPKNEE